ncbi:MAG: glutaredoxin family protein [Candidatus Taylorbacteria bacterium]
MKEISIYSTPTCVYCNMAKTFFKSYNMTFKEFNVSSDLEKRREMIDMTGQMGVPVIKVGNEVVVGFDETKLKIALDIK